MINRFIASAKIKKLLSIGSVWVAAFGCQGVHSSSPKEFKENLTLQKEILDEAYEFKRSAIETLGRPPEACITNSRINSTLPEEFGSTYSNFIQSAIKARQKIIDLSYENIVMSSSCGYKSNTFNLLKKVDENGSEYIECKIWKLNNILGTLTQETNDFNMAFDSPHGFFVVTDTPNKPLSGIAYTRAGDFFYNGEGYLVNSSGYYLMGWKLDDKEFIPMSKNTSIIDTLDLINARSLEATYRTTTKLDVQVNLPADARIGDIHSVHTAVIDYLGIAHNVLLTYTKTENCLEWNLTLTCEDSQKILQSDGVNAGSPYTNFRLQFNNVGKLLSYNDSAFATSPAEALIIWETTDSAPTLIKLNFGKLGASDATRIMGNRALTVKNYSDGSSFSFQEGNCISSEGDIYSVFRNSNKVKTHIIAVANFNGPNFLEPCYGQAFHETKESGNYVLGRANQGGNARIISGHLEKSSVNILYEMIAIKKARLEMQALMTSMQ